MEISKCAIQLKKSLPPTHPTHSDSHPCILPPIGAPIWKPILLLLERWHLREGNWEKNSQKAKYVDVCWGFPYLKMNLLVPKFQSFNISKCRAPKFQNSKVSKFRKFILLNSQNRDERDANLQPLKIQILNFPNSYVWKWLVLFSWIIWSVLVSPKINNIGFGAQRHVQKSRNHENEGFEGSPISKSKSYKLKLKQDNTTELLIISSP